MLKRVFQKTFSLAQVVIICLIFTVLWNTVPVTAAVTDNMQSAFHRLLGDRSDQVTGNYTDASANAKINALEKQVVSLQQKITELQSAANMME